MANGRRKRPPSATETDVLIRSRRRCALCFGLSADLSVKHGQIAHIDRQRTNDDPDNLCYLCLAHHDEYDSKRSQAKNFTPAELRHYRNELLARVDASDHPFDFAPASALPRAGDLTYSAQTVATAVLAEMTFRPWITVELIRNATEDERDLPDSLIFENVGEDVALGVDITTRPTKFAGATPRLEWNSVARVLPGPDHKEEAPVFAIDSYMRRLRKALLPTWKPPFPDLRVPIDVAYSDRRERRWTSEYALVHNGVGTWVEDVTGRDPKWTDLSRVLERASDSIAG